MHVGAERQRAARSRGQARDHSWGKVGQGPRTLGFSQRSQEADKAMPTTFWQGNRQGRRESRITASCMILQSKVPLNVPHPTFVH